MLARSPPKMHGYVVSLPQMHGYVVRIARLCGEFAPRARAMRYDAIRKKDGRSLEQPPHLGLASRLSSAILIAVNRGSR